MPRPADHLLPVGFEDKRLKNRFWSTRRYFETSPSMYSIWARSSSKPNSRSANESPETRPPPLPSFSNSRRMQMHTYAVQQHVGHVFLRFVDQNLARRKRFGRVPPICVVGGGSYQVSTGRKRQFRLGNVRHRRDVWT